MRSHNALVFFFLALLPPRLSAQQVSTTPTRVMGERDNAKEDEVATLFDSIRSTQRLPHLSRIRRRDILEEQVCTVALTGTLTAIPRRPDIFVMYKASHPDLQNQELNRIATFDVLHPKSKHEYPRYSVAVWRTKEPQTSDTVYWVGVHLYWSHTFLDFLCHSDGDSIYQGFRSGLAANRK
jgi:hypothetical protein